MHCNIPLLNDPPKVLSALGGPLAAPTLPFRSEPPIITPVSALSRPTEEAQPGQRLQPQQWISTVTRNIPTTKASRVEAEGTGKRPNDEDSPGNKDSSRADNHGNGSQLSMPAHFIGSGKSSRGQRDMFYMRRLSIASFACSFFLAGIIG
jgi:hypothetical protein